MSTTALIVDDEPAARAKLRRLLADLPDIACVGEAASGDEAIRLIAEQRPALLFLDIEMPAPNGLAVLRTVRGEWQPVTIFTTAHAQHALAAFELEAADYLLKPFGAERLALAVAKARKLLQDPQGGEQQISALLERNPAATGPVERYLVSAHEKYLVVRAADIVWAESAANYVVLHTRTGNHVVRRTLTQLDAELDATRFCRVSRSTIVNLDCIARIESIGAGEHLVFLTDGANVRLTRSIRELRERLESPRGS